MAISLTRTVAFHATHRYWIEEWSPERNRAAFGAATEEHAHDYRCAVTVTGVLDPETDMIADLPGLDLILAEEVVARFGGKFLNRDAPEFAEAGIQPSCEALARYCFLRIAARLPEGIGLVRVRVAEDESLYAESTRNGEP